jgi:hypothetical protein
MALTAEMVVAVKLAGNTNDRDGVPVSLIPGAVTSRKMRPHDTKYSSKKFAVRLAFGARNKTVQATTVSFKMTVGIRGIITVELRVARFRP